MNSAYRKGEMIAIYISDKKLTFETHKELSKLDTKKSNYSINKWTKELSDHFSKKKKILQIANK